MTNTPALAPDLCERARLSRDARFDGLFFTAVRTTGIYCRPICPAPTPHARNVRYFPNAASAEAAGGERSARNVWPTYVERSFAAYRAYYGFVPRGTFYVDYTLRLNNAGEFSLPATRVEAMYAPEVFGEAPNAKLLVGE